VDNREILIVDDDAQVREVLHQIFLSASYRCLQAANGQEGLEMFRAARPPLTVTDLEIAGRAYPVRENEATAGLERIRNLGRLSLLGEREAER